MEQNEYKDNEKVLYKTKGKLILPHKKPEEADCFLTDRNIVIEAEQPIRIAVARIADCALGVEQPTGYGAARGEAKPMGTVTLTYFDDLNQKQRLSLEMPTYEAALLSNELRTTIRIAQKEVLESLPLEQRCAGFWRRFAAYLLDGLILNVASWILGFTFSFLPLWLGSLVGIAFAIGSVIYFPAFWVWQGATPGKMLMGVKIVKTDGSPIGIGTAILRYVGYFVSALILFIGYLMIAWDGKKQGLHDKIAGTYVVEAA